MIPLLLALAASAAPVGDPSPAGDAPVVDPQDLPARTALARPLDTRVLTSADLPSPPPSNEARYGVVDLPEAVVVRPLGNALKNGFDYTAFDESIEAALAGRAAAYDFVMVVHTERLPTSFAGAAAFHLTYNNGELEGLNTRYTVTPDRPFRAALWMNALDYWDDWGTENGAWVFGQELGHYWLAFVEVEREGLDPDILLGRSGSHWSYWLDAGSSPVEGNAWIDNGDGTFTTDLDAPHVFSPLDLYLMGFVEAAEVPPFFAIDTDDTTRFPNSSPEHLFGVEPVTVVGARVDLSIDDILAAHGPRSPSVADSPRDFSILTVLVLGPNELLEEDTLVRLRERQDEWTGGWSEMTLGHSTVDFTVADEGRVLPTLADRTPLVPRGAW